MSTPSITLTAETPHAAAALRFLAQVQEQHECGDPTALRAKADEFGSWKPPTDQPTEKKAAPAQPATSKKKTRQSDS